MKEVFEITIPVDILAVIFTILKVTNQINWDWILVLSPLWIPLVFIGGIFALIIVAVIIYLIVVLIIVILETIMELFK